jgi:hypothetical protein
MASQETSQLDQCAGAHSRLRERSCRFYTGGWAYLPVSVIAEADEPMQGLPIALTTCLTITAYTMKKNNILCKSLATVETLGSVSLLCSDKTGTLTKVSGHFLRNTLLLILTEC